MMGTGKSTIGQLLAENLNLNFIDSDRELEKYFAKSIAQVFAEFGEKTFRQAETQQLLNLENNFVLSTGGGLILKEENRKILKNLGFILWLKASHWAIYERIKTDSERPLLKANTEEEKLNKIQKILSQREDLYAEIADLTIETDNLQPNQILEIILTKLN